MAQPKNLDLTPADDRRPTDPAPPDGQPPDSQPVGPAEADLAPPPPLTEDEVRAYLEDLGSLAGWVVPTPDELAGLWEFTDDELDGLAPPMTRVLNKRGAALRGVVENADELVLAARLGRYTVRRVATLRRFRAEGGDDAEATFGLDDEHDRAGTDAGREPFPNTPGR